MIVFHMLPVQAYLGQVAPWIYDSYHIIPYTLFGSPQEGARLSLLPDERYVPIEYIMNDTESNFDYFYWKQLQENPENFLEKLKILEPEFLEGSTSLILIQSDSQYQSMVSITESLIGYLKVFYGLEPKLVTSYEDITPELFEYSGFSPEGLYRINQDLEKKYKGEASNGECF